MSNPPPPPNLAVDCTPMRRQEFSLRAHQRGGSGQGLRNSSPQMRDRRKQVPPDQLSGLAQDRALIKEAPGYELVRFNVRLTPRRVAQRKLHRLHCWPDGEKA